ncbi:MAG: trypsin-like peptidase domain-containing protein [Sedimentisphaerales bacterium]|nr:trypsin-like peptidase domain-containing protein [Sedimentisphaerales bacterium]
MYVKKRHLRLIFGTMCLGFLVPECIPGLLKADNQLTEEEKAIVSNLNNANRRAVEIVRPAVVYIAVTKRIEEGPFPSDVISQGIGSGCIIDKRGYLITNNHVVEDSESIEVVFADGRRYESLETYLDPDTDLAIIRIDPQGQDLPVAQFGDSDQCQVGDFVLAIGSPFGIRLNQTVTAGIISYKGRQTHILGDWGYEDFIQTDADINEGNSGGPLINLYGEVIGINSNIFTPNLSRTSVGYGFAIPSNIAKFVSERLIAEGQVKRGYLGVALRSGTLFELRQFPSEYYEQWPPLKELLSELPPALEGVMVAQVMEDTPADQSGMKENDIILEINGEKVGNSKQLRDRIAKLRPDSTARFVIWRDGNEMTLEVTLGDRDLARSQDERESNYVQEDSERVPLPEFLDPFERPRQEDPPVLGITIDTLDPDMAQFYGYDGTMEGIVVVDVRPESLAEKSGLRQGDIIISVDSHPVNSTTQLKAIIRDTDLRKVGITMEVRNRDGRRLVKIKGN